MSIASSLEKPVQRSVKQGETLQDRIRSYYIHANANRAVMLDLVGEFDEAEMYLEHGHYTTSAWLQQELNLPISTAYEYVRVARGLRKFRCLLDAFEAGVMPYSTVRFLLRYLTEENEEELVDLALVLSFADLRRVVAGVEEAGEKTAPDDPFLKAHTRDDGMLDLRGLLPAVTGQELLAALKIAQLAQYGIDDVDVEDLNNPDVIDDLIQQAEAGEETCPAEQTAEPRKDTKLSTEEVLRLPSRFGPPEPADLYPAFLGMIAMVRSNPVSPLRCPGAHVNIVLTEDGRGFMPENIAAPSSVVRSYIANATVRMHLLDKRGLTLNVSRSQRFATDGQVQALLAVWGHQCAMPGCTHRRFIQIHHLREWEYGGGTDIDNLIPLCSSCHSKVSHGVAHIQSKGADLYFRFADGSQFVSRNRAMPRRTEPFEGKLADVVAEAALSFAD